MKYELDSSTYTQDKWYLKIVTVFRPPCTKNIFFNFFHFFEIPPLDGPDQLCGGPKGTQNM